MVEWAHNLKEKDLEPRRRVESCLRKLKGASPSVIMIEDLSLNPRVKHDQSLHALSNIVKNSCLNGCDKINDQKIVREDTEIFYTVEEQINDLISLSTDPDVTMRQFNGLNCWV